MSITPDDWFNRFWPFRHKGGSGGGIGYFGEMFKGFEEMRREMEREFEQSFRDIENVTPKDLISLDLFQGIQNSHFVCKI